METKESTVKAVFTIVESDKREKPLRGFVNRDLSLNILFDALPVRGKLHVRDLEPRFEEVR